MVKHILIFLFCTTLCQFRIEVSDCFYSLKELFQRVVLVWRVYCVRAKTKSHENGFCSEYSLKACYDRDTATASRRNRTFAIGFAVCCLCGLICRHINRANVSVTAVKRSYFYPHRLWSKRFEICCELFGNLFKVLVRHKAERNLCMSSRRNDGLCSLSCISAPYSATIKAWSYACAFQCGVTFFAMNLINIQGCLIGFLVKRSLIHQLSFLI